jgi:uncharacterized SAM-binding protein YcdF (DUF218 family)
MASTTNLPAPARRRRVLRLALVAAAAAALCAIVFVLFIGRWLVVEDPLERAQAIVVLSGGMPVRAIEAGTLYRQGYAPKVWLTHSTEPGKTLEAMGIPFTGEDSYDARILMHEGVPAEAITVLEPAIINTADEIAAVSAALAQEKGSTVIIVTSKVHTRRTRILWHKLAGNRGHAIVRAASEDRFNPGHWWRSTGDALEVVRELLGIANAWAGLPLHPGN